MPKNTKQTPFSKLNTLLLNPMVMIIVVVGVLVAGYFGYQKYLDWQNRNTLESFQRSYVSLVAEIQKSTGETLDITSDCFTTTEKFSEGKTVCGLLTAKNVGEDSLGSYRQVLENEDSFKRGESYRDGAGYDYDFNEVDCQFNYTENIWLDCLYPVREANKPLAAELFNEEALNTRKNTLLNQ